jgi:hypothetical protein
MRSRLVIAALSFAFLALPIVAQTPWNLVTPQEDARDHAAPHRPGPANRPGPPLIQLLRPNLSKPITNPTTIELRFIAGSGPAIDMRTFKATYGWLGINITNRLLAHAKKTQDTLLAQNVDLPPGNHSVTISIANTSGKTASQTFRFSVAR